MDLWLGIEWSIGRRRKEGWTNNWKRQGLVVWKACRLDWNIHLTKDVNFSMLKMTWS